MVRNFLDFFQELKDSGFSVSSKTMGGMFANGRGRRKWFGVRGSSFSGWSLTWVSGHEFNISSVWAKIVVKNSSVSFLGSKDNQKCSFCGLDHPFPGTTKMRRRRRIKIPTDFFCVRNYVLNSGDPIVQTGLQFTARSDKVLTVIGTQPTRVPSSGNEAAECLQKAVSSHARAGFEMAGAGEETVENDAVMIFSLTFVDNEEGTEEVNSSFFLNENGDFGLGKRSCGNGAISGWTFSTRKRRQIKQQ